METQNNLVCIMIIDKLMCFLFILDDNSGTNCKNPEQNLDGQPTKKSRHHPKG